MIGQGEARLAAARGFIAAGLESADDLGAMMQHWAAGGVRQEGQWTKLLWQEAERGRVRLTTELHRDQESELIALARAAVADRSHALSPGEIAAGVRRSGVAYQDGHGAAQRAAVEMLGTDGGLGVMIGSAGSGKTKGVLPPLVAAWQQRGLAVWGVAQAWRQAKELEGAGIKHANTRALQPFLDGVEAGQTPLAGHSVVVLDELGQIGTRQLLHLLRLRERHGFKLVAIGDDKQCQSIEAGPVIELLRQALGEARIPQILSAVRQLSEEERRIAGLFREGQARQAIDAKREAGTAELAPGGYREAVQRVADLYAERRRAARDQGPDYRITISAPTNADAREISRAVRERRREMGEIGPDQVELAATDGSGSGYTLALAKGDAVRLFSRTRALFTDAQGRRKSANIGENGSVLRIEAVLPGEGLTLRGDSGKTGFVSWAALRDKAGSGRIQLGYGDCLTIDSSQGLTSDEHVNAMPAGSRAVQGFKGYVAESRHRVRSWLVGSMGAEMREARERRPAGLPAMTPGQAEQAAWNNMVRNFEKQAGKDSALAFLERAAVRRRESAKALQGTLRWHEARQARGESATTLRRTEQAKRMRAALPQVAAAVEAVALERAELAHIAAAALPKAIDTREAMAAKSAAPPPASNERGARQVPKLAAKRVKVTELEAQQQFADAMRTHGLRSQGLPIMDGELHYVAVEGSKGKERSGAYKGFYDDSWPAGAIYNYKKGGLVGTWKADGEVVPMSGSERAELQAKATATALQRERERTRRENAGAELARQLIPLAQNVDSCGVPNCRLT